MENRVEIEFANKKGVKTIINTFPTGSYESYNLDYDMIIINIVKYESMKVICFKNGKEVKTETYRNDGSIESVYFKDNGLMN